MTASLYILVGNPRSVVPNLRSRPKSGSRGSDVGSREGFMENLIFRNANVSAAKSFCSNFMRSIHISNTLQIYSILILH
jgi:hypothetical protein